MFPYSVGSSFSTPRSRLTKWKINIIVLSFDSVYMKKSYRYVRKFLLHNSLVKLLVYRKRTVLEQVPLRKIAPTPNLTLSRILTRGQFSSGAIVWLPPNPKTNPNLDRNPNSNRGAIFLGGQLS